MFENTLFLPIDIPINTRLNELADTFVPEFEFGFWDVMRLTEPTKNYSTVGFADFMHDEWQDVIDFFDMHLPFTEYVNVKFHRTKPELMTKAHIDFTTPEINQSLYDHTQSNEPCGYRMLISGTVGKFFVVDGAGVKTYGVTPPETNTFVMRASDGIHGADQDQNRMILYFQGILDQDKHRQILERSYQKYKDSMISYGKA